MIVPPGSIPATTLPGSTPRNPAAPPMPSFTPQAVQFPGSPGQGPGFSLSDHIHAGVKEVIAGTNVTIGGDATSPVINATGGAANSSFRFLADVSSTGWTGSTRFDPLGSHNIYDNPSGMLSPTTLLVTIPPGGGGVYLAGAVCNFQEVSNVDGKYNFFLGFFTIHGPFDVSWPLQFYKSTDASGSTSACFGEGWSATQLVNPSATVDGATFEWVLDSCTDNPQPAAMVITYWMARLYAF